MRESKEPGVSGQSSRWVGKPLTELGKAEEGVGLEVGKELYCRHIKAEMLIKHVYFTEKIDNVNWELLHLPTM